MAKATTFANDVLDWELSTAASGTAATATYVAPYKVLFLSTISSAGTQGTEWSTSGGYTHSAGAAVGGVSLSGLFTSAASGAAKANTGAVTVTNAPAGTWADNEIVDSTVTTNKRICFKGTPSLAKTVNASDTCTIAIGALSGTET